MHKIQLTDQEIAFFDRCLESLMNQYETADDPHFLDQAAILAHELPRRVRGFFNEFRLHEPDAGCIVSGFPISDITIGATPPHWKERQVPSQTLREEMYLVLMGSLLGDLFGWSTQQDGRLIHDVFPIEGHQDEQLGSGSKELLWWHTEDAFHPYRGDYIGLMCLRNPDQVATTIAAVEHLDLHELEEEMIHPLFEKNYTIRPDNSHLPKNNSKQHAGEGVLQSSYERIESMKSRPKNVALLFGDRRSPYLRIDPFFMEPTSEETIHSAYELLCQRIDSRIQDVVLEPGDTIFIDNFRCVHGRKPFHARFDGTDRWLKRINVTRDLRKSREVREAPGARLIL